MHTAQTAPPQDAPDDDFAASAPTVAVRIGSGVLMVAGLLTALAGLQLVLSRLVGPVAVVPYVLLLLGGAGIAIGWVAGRARLWAARAGLALGVVLAFVNLGWFVYAVAGGVYSCMSLVSIPVSIGAAAAMVFTLAPARRATEARVRMRAQGLDVGI